MVSQEDSKCFRYTEPKGAHQPVAGVPFALLCFANDEKGPSRHLKTAKIQGNEN